MTPPSISATEAPAPVEQATATFLAARETLEARCWEPGADGLELAGRLARVTDTWLLALWEEACRQAPQLAQGTGLSALGGYGRCELAFNSDLDLQIEVLDEALLEPEHGLGAAVERLMAWARVDRLKMGHAVRTAAQAHEQMAVDARTAVALLDRRPLKDSAPDRWEVGLEQARAYLRGDDEGRGFAAELMLGFRSRLERCGKTVYLLEPDVKSGAGGLRDLQAIRWASMVRWGFDPWHEQAPEAGWDAERQRFALEAVAALMMVRHRLHLLHGRAHDRLHFPDQERIALAAVGPLGGEEDDPAVRVAAAEALMRAHYSVTRRSHRLAERVLRRAMRPTAEPRGQALGPRFERRGDEVLALRREEARAEPLDGGEVLEAFELAAAHGLRFEPQLEDRLASRLSDLSQALAEEPGLGPRFAALLCDPRTGERQLEDALELGLLVRMIPEFDPVICHVQHDTYHVYTTDVHLLRCLERARALLDEARAAADPVASRWPQFSQVARGLGDPQVFLLAALLHDVGKNRGGDHSLRGAELVRPIGRRLGLEEAQIEALSALVAEHLLLSNTSRRRDIADPAVIRDVAERLEGSLPMLDALYALTFCDMSTVSPNVVNDWNVSLLSRLYHRLRLYLQAQEDEGVAQAWATRLAARKRELTEHLAQGQEHDGQDQELARFVEDLPPGHVVMSDAAGLARQFTVYRESLHTGRPALLFTPLDEQGVTEIIVAAPDTPGALARMAGALAAGGINIHTAEIVTSSRGQLLDIFRVTQSHTGLLPQHEPPTLLRQPARIARLREQLVAVLTSQQDVEALLEARRAQQKLGPRPQPAAGTEVSVNQEESPQMTIIEVRAPDRLGLLYDIASTLWRCGVSTRLSKIDSLGARVVDIFYVERRQGGKLHEEEVLRVVEALEESLAARG